jgi:hypothetical protein
MFERYTEVARRVIFFARYEASQFGSPSIECEHLLLGMLREPTPLREQLAEEARWAIRKAIEDRLPRQAEIPATVDLPLSDASKRALTYAAEEADRMKHGHIGPEHLLLGLLREESNGIANLLQPYGIRIEDQREKGGSFLSRMRTESALLLHDEDLLRITGSRPGSDVPAANASIERLAALMDRLLTHLDHSAKTGQVRLRLKPWTRKQAIGHLIDWATAHHQLFARALTEPDVAVPPPAPDAWVEAERYAHLPWTGLVRLWASLNGLILHVLSQLPAEKLNIPCRIGIAEPVPLSAVIDSYVAHCEDLAAEIVLHPGN